MNLSQGVIQPGKGLRTLYALINSDGGKSEEGKMTEDLDETEKETKKVKKKTEEKTLVLCTHS
jgi:hypothetical protein